MKNIKRAVLLAFVLVIVCSMRCSAATRYNAFLMGDSIIDNYPHSANGLEYYLKKDTSFNVVCDYSYEGTLVCTDAKAQRAKLVKQLKKYVGQKNVVILSMGTNDYFKKCENNHNKLLKKRLAEIREIDPKVKIVIIIPTHIYRVRNDAKIRAIYDYQENDKWMSKYTIDLKTKDYLSSSDIRSDCLHFTSSGYKKTVKQIKRVLGL